MSNYLKSIRALNGLKQRDMAKLLGITEAGYCKKENGNIEFSISDLKILKKFFELTDREFCKIFFEEN